MAAESMISDQAKAMIGRVTGRGSGVAYLKEAQRWAAAANDRNPLYFDDEAAKAAGYRGVIIPPLFITQVTQGVSDLATLRPDGIPGAAPPPPAGQDGDSAGAGANLGRMMFGGEEIELFGAVYPGDELVSESRFQSIEEKKGRSGPFLLITHETTYTNQHGEVVAKSRTYGISK